MKTNYQFLLPSPQAFVKHSPKGRVSRVLLYIAIAVAGELLAVFQAPAQVYDWAREISGNTYNTKVVAQEDGDYFVMGQFYGTIYIGNKTLNSNGGLDIFISYFNKSKGTPYWTRQIGGPYDDEQADFALDATGNYLYVTGSFTESVILETYHSIKDTLTGFGMHDIFIAKYYTFSGTLSWATRAGAGLEDQSRGIAVDGGGNALLTGYFTGGALFQHSCCDASNSPWLIVNGPDADISQETFLAKYTPEGKVQWVRTSAGSSGGNYGVAVKTDAAGNAYLAGNYGENITFAEPSTGAYTNLTTENLSPPEGTDGFIAKYSPEGLFLWANKIGGYGYEGTTDIAVNDGGSAYVLGYYAAKTLNFYHNTGDNARYFASLSPGGSADVFIAKYKPTGKPAWVRKIAGQGYDIGAAIAVEKGGDGVYLTGDFSGTLTVRGTSSKKTLTAAGGKTDRDMFIIRYNREGGVSWAKREGDRLSAQYGDDVTYYASKRLYVSGRTDGTTLLGKHQVYEAVAFILKIRNYPPGTAGGRVGSEAAPSEQEPEEGSLVAYPNPFSDKTTLTFTAPDQEPVKLEVFDAKGLLIKTLFNGEVKGENQHDFSLEGTNLKAGMYIVRLTTSQKVLIRRVVLMR